MLCSLPQTHVPPPPPPLSPLQSDGSCPRYTVQMKGGRREAVPLPLFWRCIELLSFWAVTPCSGNRFSCVLPLFFI